MDSKKIDLMRRTDIDIAKALGIIFVMISHGCGFPFRIGYYITASYMALFFFISGYTTRKDSNTDILVKIKKKFKQLIIPYFMYSVIL